MSETKKKTTIKVLILFASTSLLFLHYQIVKPWMLDDAFISFRYAQNFANGDGLVFNPGGEHTEGYTNFLWVIILGLGKLAGFNIVALSKILGFLFSAGTIGLILFFKYKAGFLTRVISAIILSTAGSFTVWATSGMETSLFTFLFTLLTLYTFTLSEKTSKRILVTMGVVNSLLALTRPEGYIYFPVLLLILIIKYFSTNDKKRIFKNLLYFSVPFLLTALGQFSFRIIYYNDFLPNTFYNKVGSTTQQILRGIRYTRQFFGATSLVVFPILLWFIVELKHFLKNKTSHIRKNFSNFSLVFVLFVNITYVTLVGGDVMPGYRFFAPITPLVCLLSASSIIYFADKLKQKKAVYFIFLLSSAGIICVFNLSQWKLNIKFNKHLIGDHVARNGREAGLWLKQNFPEETVIATNTAGTIPYYSKFITVDMLGLNNKHIAKRKMTNMGSGYPGHEKTDGTYILDQNPDIIQFGSSLGSVEPILVSDKELAELEKFWANYELKSYALPSGKTLHLYMKKGFYEKL